MDFDPHGAKWQCCCCNLPSGLQILATGEMIICTVIAAITAVHIASDPKGPSYFEGCLILMMVIMALTSALLILGIHRHQKTLMYPSIGARGLLIIFIQAFGVSTVVSPQPEVKPTTSEHFNTYTLAQNQFTTPPPGAAPGVALRLVLLVFAMLFLTVFIFYCIYLLVRGIHYEKCYARLKERRASLIQAGMIDPDFGSRRTSNA